MTNVTTIDVPILALAGIVLVWEMAQTVPLRCRLGVEGQHIVVEGSTVCAIWSVSSVSQNGQKRTCDDRAGLEC